ECPPVVPVRVARASGRVALGADRRRRLRSCCAGVSAAGRRRPQSVGGGPRRTGRSLSADRPHGRARTHLATDRFQPPVTTTPAPPSPDPDPRSVGWIGVIGPGILVAATGVGTGDL